MSSQPVQSVESTREQLLDDVRRCAAKVKNWAWWRAGLTWLTIVLATLLLLMTLDVLLRREELGLRLLSLTTLLAVILWAAHRFLRPLLAFQPTSVQLARWIEAQNPNLGKRFSTVVEIAEIGPTDNRYGSRYFQEVVLRDWSTEPHKPDWQSQFDTTKLWKAAGPLAIVCAFIAGGAISWPVESTLAFKRLAAPWSSNAWPRRDQLEFRNLPSVVGIGSEIQLEIVDRNPLLPDEVTVLLRDNLREELGEVRIATKQIDDVAIANLPAPENAIEVRAVGGDDQNMPWQRIEVVAPPALEKYHFEITPPDYTEIAPSELVGNRIQVLAESRVKFRGRLNEAVAAVKLNVLNIDTGTSSSPQSWDVALSQDGRSITIGGERGSALLHSVSWRFVFTTLNGLRIEPSESWSVEVTVDSPPNVSLEAPSMRRIAADAQLQIRGNAQDDLRLVEVKAWAKLESENESEPIAVVVWENGDKEVRELDVDRIWEFANDLAGSRQITASSSGQTIRKTLIPGDVVNIWLEARDSRGQIGRSQKERLEVQSADNLLNEILSRQAELLRRIRELVDSQRRNVQLAEQASQRLSDSRPVSQQDVDAFTGVAELQRAIASGLAGDRASIAAEVRNLQTLLELNQLQGLPADKQLRILGEQIELISGGVMRDATDAATSAQRLVRDHFSGSNSAQGQTLAQANRSVDSQNTALESLLKLTDRVDRSGALQQIQRDFSSLATQQTMLQQDTESLQLDSLNGATADEIERRKGVLSSEQLSLAQRLDSLINRSRELIAAEDDEVSGLVDELRGATELMTERQVGRLMRQSKEQLDAERFASSAETQETAARTLSEALRKMRSQTTQRSDSNLEGRAADLRETSQQLEALADAQARLAEQMRGKDAATRADNLADEQTKLAEETKQQSDHAAAEGDQRSAEAIRNAGENQQAAEQFSNQRQMQQAADAAQRAAEQLDTAAAELEQRASQLDGEAQQQQLYQLGSQLEQLSAQQQTIVQQLIALAENTDTDFESQARQQASQQEGIRQQLAETRRQADKLPTFEWALQQVESDMARATAAAQRYRIAPDAITAATDALTKLRLAAAASASTSEEPKDTASENPDDNSDSEQGETLPPLASLKLLRGLQNEINEQTRATDSELDQTRRKKRLGELSQQQQALGEQLGELLQKSSMTPEEAL